MADSPDMAARSPTTSDQLCSTMDIGAFRQKDGTLVYKVIVTNSDGNQYVSDQKWKTKAEAYAALREHLKALGVPDDQIEVSQVH